MPATHVVLLRGINLGGKNKVPMAPLRGHLADLGCTDVATLIASGNIVLTPPEGAQIDDLVRTLIADHFSLDIPVVSRTAADFRASAERHPFAHLESDPRFLAVGYMSTTPTDENIASLDPARSPGDSFRVDGREVYVHYANGTHKSKLTNAWFERRLATAITFRNSRTVRRVAEML